MRCVEGGVGRLSITKEELYRMLNHEVCGGCGCVGRCVEGVGRGGLVHSFIQKPAMQ